MSGGNRCAIYTRKSSEEGLDQAFNSLDAQREACIAYIQSQKHEGWIATPEHYDDGGFSGGNMERPALRQLLADIQAGKIATVVVYKVDRLTRSLSDFAKIIDIFDQHKVSFVSVTQQFNTTTSMGRLTLNVLLSFAQFERELTGERIRDKIAASKKKGMWMGGVVPLGYNCVDRRLIINPSEAELIREIFRQYLRLGSVSKLKDYLDAAQIRTKSRISSSGRKSGVVLYSRGALSHLLNNRLYIGHIAHRGNAYPGQHKPIIEQQLWNRVRERLKANNQAHRHGKSQSTPSLLTGILHDANGVRFTPTHALKKGKRYRYYTSQAAIHRRKNRPDLARISAPELERLVSGQIQRMLESPEKYLMQNKISPQRDELLQRAKVFGEHWCKSAPSTQDKFVKGVLRAVIVGQKTVSIQIDRKKLIEHLLGPSSETRINHGMTEHGEIVLNAKLRVSNRGPKSHIFMPEYIYAEQKPVPSLVKAIARARDWYERIVSGEVNTVNELAQDTHLTSAYVERIIRCALLSPTTIEAILTGRHRPHLTLTELTGRVPLIWQQQETNLVQH